ncbi:MAG: hypothetical protein RL708_961 [Bacteroidota bacterium]|jgi:hypothetical protein
MSTKTNATTSSTNNTKPSTSSTNAQSTNTKYLHNKYKVNKARDNDEQKDAMMFESLLQGDNKNQNFMVNALQEQQKNNQQFNQQEDEEKKDTLKSDGLKDVENKNVVEAGKAEKTHTTEFCQALSDNHNKHNFEVTLPKLGTFKVQTSASGKNLKFDISTKEKNAYDWMSKNQSSIEDNVGKDLNLDVSLGIEYVI